jgi:hypothetical protein
MYRSTVEELEYGVAARVESIDDQGEEVPQSDRIAEAMRIGWEAERVTGRPSKLVIDDRGPAALIELGDASDPEYENVAGALLEVTSCR